MFAYLLFFLDTTGISVGNRDDLQVVEPVENLTLFLNFVRVSAD